MVFILLLATIRARTNAAAFLIGWSISLIIVFAVSYAVGGAHATQHGSGSTAVEVIEILLGAALAVAAARQWRHRDQLGSRQEVHGPPQAAQSVGSSRRRGHEAPGRLTAAAVLLVRHHSAFLTVVFAFLAFVLLSTASIGLIFLYFARCPGQAEAHLSDLRDRLVRAGTAIFAIVSVAVGVYLISTAR